MSINLSNSNVAVRETRIESITGYIWSLKDLSENFSVEKYNSIHLNKAEDDEVFINVKFLNM